MIAIAIMGSGLSMAIYFTYSSHELNDITGKPSHYITGTVHLLASARIPIALLAPLYLNTFVDAKACTHHPELL